jgi:uncharacterized SAM-binding protein YcdF (DUF218 family)
VDIVDQAAKLLVPGSLSLLVIAVAVGVALMSLRGRLARVGRAWLVITAAAYCALSSPAVASVLERGLVRRYTPLRHAAAARGASAVVIFGNGVFLVNDGERVYHAMQRHTFENVIEGARLVRLLQPRYVITSGGIVYPSSQTRSEADVMREALGDLGVPPERVETESESRNTYEQVMNVARLLRQAGIAQSVVVTAAPHMPRVIGLFRKQGLSPVASIPLTAYATRGSGQWLFNFRALEDSEAASYEYLALVGYWLRGRI